MIRARQMLKILILASLAAPLSGWTQNLVLNGGPLSSACGLPHPPQSSMALDGARVMVVFSPAGDSERLILRAIAAAQHEILVQAYSFTNRRIISALGKAMSHGIDVRVIVDKTDTQPYEGHKPVASVIRAEHIPVWVDSKVNIAHNKVMILDDKDVITGSYNFTYSAEYDNAENLLYIRNAPQLAKAYADNWHWRQSCSQPYDGRPVY
ncbi:MAG: phospholipase D family protein [Gammaproteobacteria bacterium]|nr:phospholipase D family protein [Gammaproteobacteria bacterium]